MTTPLPRYTPLWATAREAARLICMAESTFREHVASGLFPRPEVVDGCQQWSVQAVDEALGSVLEAQKNGKPEPLYMRDIHAALQRRPTTNVYFASCQSWVKVGRANCVSERLREMQSGNAHNIVLIADFPGTPAMETAIHHALAHLRFRGEWFDQHEDIETVIACLRERCHV